MATLGQNAWAEGDAPLDLSNARADVIKARGRVFTISAHGRVFTVSGGTMRIQTFDTKDPSEIVVLGFDFAADLDLGETLIGASATVNISSSNDANAIALLSGSPVVSGGVVTQVIATSSVAPADYRVQATVDTSTNRRLILVGVLPVRIEA